MNLIVGLGNPGTGHANDRHNFGFMALDAIGHYHKLESFKKRGRFFGSIIEGNIGDNRVILLKPMTYMNNSGQSVAAVLNFYKLSTHQVVVLHDELDLNLGRVKVKIGGGNAGHNGLRSITSEIGNNFWRVRLGIGRPQDQRATKDHVLSKFSSIEIKYMQEMINDVATSISDVLKGDTNKFMAKLAHNKSTPDIVKKNS